MGLKYIVTVNHDQDEKEEIFIFSDSVIHNCLAEGVGYLKNSFSDRNWKRERREVIAAGFTDGETCWGESESLRMKSRKELDAKLLRV